MKKLTVDLATRLRLPRVEVIFQSDVVYVRFGADYKVAKSDKERVETRLPRLFYVESIELVEGRIITTISPADAGYDGKDRIERK